VTPEQRAEAILRRVGLAHHADAIPAIAEHIIADRNEVLERAALAFHSDMDDRLGWAAAREVIRALKLPQ
jgi:hypothetical protein